MTVRVNATVSVANLNKVWSLQWIPVLHDTSTAPHCDFKAIKLFCDLVLLSPAVQHRIHTIESLVVEIDSAQPVVMVFCAHHQHDSTVWPLEVEFIEMVHDFMQWTCECGLSDILFGDNHILVVGSPDSKSQNHSLRIHVPPEITQEANSSPADRRPVIDLRSVVASG